MLQTKLVVIPGIKFLTTDETSMGEILYVKPKDVAKWRSEKKMAKLRQKKLRPIHAIDKIDVKRWQARELLRILMDDDFGDGADKLSSFLYPRNSMLKKGITSSTI